MKRVTILFTVVFLAIFSQKMNAQQTIKVSVENISSTKGKVAIGLFDRQNFLKKPIKGVFAEIKNGKSIAIFKNIPKEEYAIGCYHDVNNNQQLDFSNNGTPLEDCKLSNSKKLNGVPVFDDAKFRVEDKDLNFVIKF
ncbi:MAG: DUF2141 domain-containing protein [Flavobacteriaceae bacterium]|nr:DUF2141 domain-containing protein [Flavobacteriaceae bacterium]